MKFYAGRTGADTPSTRIGRLSGLTALTVIVRDAPVRWARLCRDMPHRWWSMPSGQVCLRCSRYEQHEELRPRRTDDKWRGARHHNHR